MGWLSRKWRQIKGWFTPSQPKLQGVNIEKKGTNQGVPIIYGFVKKAPCIKVFKTTTDKNGGADNEYLHFICVFSVGEIEGIGKLYFNDIPQEQIDAERYFIKKYTGSENQSYCAELAANFSQWKRTAKLKNVAYAYVRLKQNKKVNWWQGEPSISADIEGLKVLDVRDMQLKYSQNAALCVYDYLTNTRYGKGLAFNKLDTQSFIDAANFVETRREYTKTVYRTRRDKDLKAWERAPVGKVKETIIENLLSCNVRLDSEKTIKDNVEILLGGMRAILPESNGKYRIAIEKDDPPVFAFTRDNLIGAIQCKGGSQSDRYNQVIIRFRNKLTGEEDEAVFPANDAEENATESTLHQTWKTQDSGKYLLGEFDFDTINNKAEALQMGHVIAYRSRDLMGALFTGTPETMVVEAGDIVTLDSQILGWQGKPFRIESVELDLKTGAVEFQAVEHQAIIYPWAISDVVEEYADTSLALPQDIDPPTRLAYQTIVDDKDFLGELSWNDPNDLLVTGYEIIVKNAETDAVVFSQETSELCVKLRHLSVGKYTATVVARNALFISNAAVLQFTVILPGGPTVTIDAINHNSVTLSATVAGVLSLNTTFQWQYLGTKADPQEGNIAQGEIYTFTGLLPETDFNFQCRSVNVAGVSAWLKVVVSTINAQAVFDTYNLDIQLEQLNQATQETLNAIPEMVSRLTTAEEVLSDVEFDADKLNDVVIAQQQFDSELTETKAQASESNTLVAQLNEQLTFYARKEKVVSLVDEASTQVSETLSSEFNHKIAQVVDTTQTLTNLNTRLAERSTSLEAKVDLAEGETVSTAMQTLARAQVSYCTIGRDSKGNIIRNSQACARVGGVWIDDKPLSELFEVAQVTKKDGSTANAKSFLQTLETQTGQLQARAFFGIDANGKTGGLTVQTVDGNGNVGSTTISLDLTAGAIVLRDSSGKPAVYFDTEKGRHTFKGTIEATELILSDGFVYDKAGLKGNAGVQGRRGTSGRRGIRGVRGTEGIKGTKGVQGSNGPKGSTGATGTTGRTGATGQTGADGLLPRPKSGVQGLKANSQYLGFWNGSKWKTYIDKNGRIYGKSKNALFDFNPNNDSLAITTTNMIMGGGGGSTFEAIRTSRSGSAFMFKNGFGKVKVYISDTGILAVKADKYQIADFYSNGAGLYSFFVEGKRAIYASGGVTPFTGAHLGVMSEAVNYEFGDLIKRLHVLAKPDISNSISSLALSDSYKQKTCYGVIAKDMSMIDYINITKDTPLGLPLEQISINDRMITINSVGEGLINVCGLGGNIENGDNLCASSMPGKAQCQGDDLLYNYTVAESHEAVVFDTPEQVKQIACTYKF